ncbi:MAG: hypothetical protein IPO00_08265 [Betaproteobacteria bacterium]|nr:hypothetical protein [Betaproteobacteria bacterium]
MESVLQLQEGEIAVLGGLMEDSVTDQTGRVPGVGAIPIFGDFLRTNDATSKNRAGHFHSANSDKDPSSRRFSARATPKQGCEKHLPFTSLSASIVEKLTRGCNEPPP